MIETNQHPVTDAAAGANTDFVTREVSRVSSIRMIGLRLFFAAGLYLYAHVAYRVRIWGRLPRRRPATLVLANHQHDLDGMVAPSVLNLRRPWRSPVYCVSSQRWFEPGFLSVRLRVRIRTWMYRWNLAKLFHALGVLPIENQPLSRPDASLAYDILCDRGDLPLQEVFTERALARYDVRPDDTLRSLWHHRNGSVSLVEGSLRNLQPPYRQFIRERERTVIEQQANRLVEVLRAGGTMFMTPEGRYSTDGRLAPLRASLELLLPIASKVYLFGLSYELFTRRRATFLGRVVPFEHRNQTLVALAQALCAARPITFTQLFCDWVRGRATRDLERASSSSDVDSFTVQDVHAALQDKLARLPERAFVDPDLKLHLRHTIARAMRNLVRLGMVRVENARLHVTDRRTNEHFPSVPDIISYQSEMFRETMAAIEALEA